MVDTYQLHQHRDVIREAADMNWRIALYGFLVSNGFIGGWVTFGTIGGAVFSSVILSAALNSDLIDGYHGLEGRSRGNRFWLWKSISSTSLSSVGS